MCVCPTALTNDVSGALAKWQKNAVAANTDPTAAASTMTATHCRRQRLTFHIELPHFAAALHCYTSPPYFIGTRLGS